jgi:tripartite-type tricarboxylate transporter receptor subunit TctC
MLSRRVAAALRPAAMALTLAVPAALVAVAALTTPSAHADPVADFYRGTQINLIVGLGSGGGYDIYARLLAQQMGRYIPGNPTIAVQNMPGAGSLRAANYLYTTAPRDGTVIATFSRNVPLIGAIKQNANVQFDPRKFVWLGSSSSFANDAYIMIVRKDAPVQSADEARRPGGPSLVLGGTAEGATANDVPVILRDTIGFHIKRVVGYPDSSAIFVAIERGEVHGRTVDLSSVKSVKPEWLKRKSGYRVLVQFARATRHPDFPDVPTARELAKDDKARALIELAEIPYALSRPFAAPPGVPAERAAALQAAFLAVHKDPLYLAEAAKLRIEVSPVGSEEVLSAIDRILAAPPEMLDYLKRLLSENKAGG